MEASADSNVCTSTQGATGFTSQSSNAAITLDISDACFVNNSNTLSERTVLRVRAENLNTNVDMVKDTSKSSGKTAASNPTQHVERAIHSSMNSSDLPMDDSVVAQSSPLMAVFLKATGRLS